MNIKTRQVNVGGVRIGAGAPVSVQSMTNTDTRDVEKTLEQIGALEAAGCDIVRLAVFDEVCAKNIAILKRRTNIPLVADIHFDYRLGIAAIENGVDKLRFNPGNIGSEINVKKLVDAAKARNVPIRIGVNGGSLDKPLLDKFGAPTPEAMVESALQHVGILERAGFYDIVISLKASDVPTCVAAYRLMHEHVDYPLHIGITEAGFGESAVIKSSVGIGALLLEGIGDTIRVSITGDPVNEGKAGIAILRAAGLRRSGIEVISCPTCGRCAVALEPIARRIEAALPKLQKGYLKLAVMGCAVNGPGEASEADIGIAFGHENAVVFKNGEKFFAAVQDEAIEVLITEAKLMINGSK